MQWLRGYLSQRTLQSADWPRDRCPGLLRQIAVVEQEPEILAILTPLGLARPHERPFAHGPPLPEVAVLIDAITGDGYALDPPACPPRLPYPKPRHESIRFRAEIMVLGEDFDQTGFELPLAPPEDPAQPELFADDYSQPDAADGEPVFWADGPASRPRTTTSFKPTCLRAPHRQTRRNQFENSRLDRE